MVKTSNILIIGGLVVVGALVLNTLSKKQDTRPEDKSSIEPSAVGIAPLVDAGKFIVKKGGSVKRGIDWVSNPIFALSNYATAPVRRTMQKAAVRVVERVAEDPQRIIAPIRFAPVVGQVLQPYIPIGQKASSWLYQKIRGKLS